MDDSFLFNNDEYYECAISIDIISAFERWFIFSSHELDTSVSTNFRFSAYF